MVSGIYQPNRGRITFEGENVTIMPPSRIAERGVARSFQDIALFHGMTVLDNLMLGRHARLRVRAGAFAAFATAVFVQANRVPFIQAIAASCAATAAGSRLAHGRGSWSKWWNSSVPRTSVAESTFLV